MDDAVLEAHFRLSSQGCDIKRSVFKTGINITLAIRLALRRYLGLEPRLQAGPS
jgi:hypothetical protein